MNGGHSAMKQRTKYSKRILAVLLAVMMLLAAAQPISLVAAVGEDPDPHFEEGIARARYTTGGTLELSFPVATSPGGGIAYWADLYDLDRDYASRETPLNASPIELEGVRQTMDNANLLISAVLSPEQLAAIGGLDMSHRISVAITAVDGAGWRSQPMEALVGESLAIPADDSSPEGNFVTFEDFNETTGNGNNENSGKTPPAWMYNNVAGDEQTGNNNYTPANIDGVFIGNNDAYQTPGFNTSNAFRVYMKNAENSSFTEGSTPSSVNGYQRLDIGYTPATRNFVNADEMWIWVDTSYVEFDEFALQARYLDRGGDLYLNADLGLDNSYVRSEEDINLKYSQDVYSTIGYAAKNNGASVPVYYQNEDGLWDTIYTNNKGYLENFGHYRGFLRVPVDKLWNETENSSYNQLTEERVYSYKIKIYDSYIGVNTTVKEFTAQEAYESPDATFSWQDTYTRNGLIGQKRWMYFQKDQFAQNYAPGLTVIPLEDIASVGITWKGASEDSVNKSFYIDQMGFSGTGMNGTPVNSLTTSNTAAVQTLVEKYLPDDLTLINISHASVIADLRAICTQLGINNAALDEAEAELAKILGGSETPVDWLSGELDRLPVKSSYSAEEIEQIKNYFELYRTLTLGDIHRLGTANEAKLITAYNAAELSEWYPSALTQLYYKAFNDVERNYTLGQTALHEYDDYRLGPDGKWHYYDRAHNLPWDNNYKGAWENSRNLVAYSRMSYDATETGTNDVDQRFGLASTSIGQNGFAGSRSIDTSFYRDSLVNGETYRISLTNGDNKNNWDELGSVNIGSATDFIFYADFSEMNDLRKLWITLRTADGKIYSHDEDNSQWNYQILNMNDVNPAWKDVLTDADPDGCLTGDPLNGFRGFIKIPLSHFREIGNRNAAIPANSDVKQMKLFYTGTQGGTSPAGTSVYLDMFGFVSSVQGSGFEQLKPQTVTAPNVAATTVEETQAAILALYKDVTLLGDTQEQPHYLFNYSNQQADVDAYRAMLAQYYTLTVAQKAELEKQAEVEGKIADMAAVVRNYDTYNGIDGNLKTYVRNANEQFNIVKDNFKTEAVETAPVTAVLEEYKGYPDKYKNTVQTYWADRNLNAVYPNFTVTTSASSEEPQAPVATMKLDSSRTHYAGSVTLEYYAAVDTQNQIELVTAPTGKITLTADDGSGETVEASLGGGRANPLNGKNSMTFNLSVPETEVTHAVTYSGEFQVLVKSPAIDDGTNQPSNPIEGGIASAGQYRMQSYTVYVKLVFDAEYEVVIPADVSILWDLPSASAGDLRVTKLHIPSTAAVNVSVNSEVNNYHMVWNSFKIPYDLVSGGAPFRSATFTMDTPPDGLTKPLAIEVDNWNASPSDQYKDTLTFTVNYTENAQ